MPNQKQDTPVFDVGKATTRKDKNRALPFHTTYDGGGQLAAEYSVQLSTAPQISYLTTDHLGSPRVITNQTGAVSSRKDFNAYGEETFTSQRTTGLHYLPTTQPREVRSDYTGYQKDEESGLEYAQARYYNSAQGRFTSVDPLTASASIKDPQTFNRYTYALNSPYKFTDPLGLAADSEAKSAKKQKCNLYCRAMTNTLSDEDAKLIRLHVIAGTAFADLLRTGLLQAAQNATQTLENPTNPHAPVPGSADFTPLTFSELKDSPKSTKGSEAAKKLLVDKYGDGAEMAYNSMSGYDKAVFVNTIATIWAAHEGIILEKAKYEGLYKGAKGDDKFASGVVLSGVTKEVLDLAELGTSCCGIGRRSPKRIGIASLEATDEHNGNFAFDVDLYNFKAHPIKHLLWDKGFNHFRKVTTHPADVARALRARGVDSGVTTP